MLGFIREINNTFSHVVLGALCFFLCALPHPAMARNVDLEVIAAAEDIGILSQSVVKNYFYVRENINTVASAIKLSEDIKAIDVSLAKLVAASELKGARGELNFIDSIWIDLKVTMNDRYSRDNGLLVIDLSEVMLEGAENLSKRLYKKGFKDSNIINIIEHQRYLVERMAKLYVISIAGLKDFNVKQQIAAAVESFDEGMVRIESKQYSKNISVSVNELRSQWQSSRPHYLNVEEGDMPASIFVFTEAIESHLIKMFHYYNP